jgi:hypothetical protein
MESDSDIVVTYDCVCVQCMWLGHRTALACRDRQRLPREAELQAGAETGLDSDLLPLGT